MATVFYSCPAHGRFAVSVACGAGRGPAPATATCPSCSRRSDRYRWQPPGKRQVLLPSDVYDELARLCADQGITIEDWVRAHLPSAARGI